jgi:hypothetical protein
VSAGSSAPAPAPHTATSTQTSTSTILGIVGEARAAKHCVPAATSPANTHAGDESSGLKIDSSLRVRFPLSVRTNEKRGRWVFSMRNECGQVHIAVCSQYAPGW